MRVVSNKALVDFASTHPTSNVPLQSWRKTVESRDFAHLADLKQAFNTVDRVGDVYVFDIGGNKLRIVAAIHFNRRMLSNMPRLHAQGVRRVEALTFSSTELDDLGSHFRALDARIPLHPIRSAAAYDTAVRAMNALVDAGAGREDHPLADLLDLLGTLIGDYDDAHHALPQVPPAALLRWLMDRHGLRQVDLPEIGSQGVVSEVLSGKRELNAGQIRRLSERFGVGPSAFL